MGTCEYQMWSVIAARLTSHARVASSSQIRNVTSRGSPVLAATVTRCTHSGVKRGRCFSQIPRGTAIPSGKRSMVSGLSRRYGKSTGATAR